MGMMRYLLDGMDVQKKEISGISKKIDEINLRIEAIKVFDAEVKTLVAVRGRDEVTTPINKGKEICHALEDRTTGGGFTRPITEFELGEPSSSINEGRKGKSEEMVLTISLRTPERDPEEEQRAIKCYLNRKGYTRTNARIISAETIDKTPVEEEDVIHMPIHQHSAYDWDPGAQRHERSVANDGAPPDRRANKTIAEETHRRLTETHDLVVRELKPIDAETSRIRLNLLKSITAKQKSIEKVMQDRSRHRAIISRRMPEKQGDPGSFSIPCIISGVHFPRCLIDLGASVSIMPYTTARRLRFRDFKETDRYVVMADNSVKFPVGILEDVEVQIGNDLVFTSFMVLEMDTEPPDPIILGRPFMATTKMKIDVGKSQMELDLGDHSATFGREEATQKPQEHSDRLTEREPNERNGIPLKELLINLDELTGGTELYDLYLEWQRGVKKRKSTEADRAAPGPSWGRLTENFSGSSFKGSRRNEDTPPFTT